MKKYETPVIVDLGALARGSGGCNAGSAAVVNKCATGGKASGPGNSGCLSGTSVTVT